MEKVVRIVNLHSQPTDFSYWQTKTPQERLAALEVLRQQYIQFKNVQPGLQRVCRIVNWKEEIG